MPAGHVHAPAWQDAPPEHASPHAPQFAPFVWRSTHAPPHDASPCGQPATQTPFEHA
jgi:hypothetical protein